MNIKKEKRYRIYFVISFILALATFWYGTGFVRNYAYDFFSVMYLYFGLRGFFGVKMNHSIFVTIVIAYGIEIYQWFGFNYHEESYLYSFFLGGTADLWDLAAYHLGLVVPIFLEIFIEKTDP